MHIGGRQRTMLQRASYSKALDDPVGDPGDQRYIVLGANGRTQPRCNGSSWVASPSCRTQLGIGQRLVCGALKFLARLAPTTSDDVKPYESLQPVYAQRPGF